MNNQSPFSKVIASLLLFTYSAWLIAGGLGVRAGVLLHSSIVGDVVANLDLVVLILSVSWSIQARLRRVWLHLTVASVILGHSFASLYWPSLRIGVPIQDYLLADQVSSNYSFHWALVLWRHAVVAVVGAITARSAYEFLSRRWRVYFRIVALMLFVVTFAVVSVQKFWHLDFLAEGAGNSMSAIRAPGLLEDSGASTVFCAILAAGAYFLALFGRFHAGYRCLCMALVVWALISGSATGGRVFFAASLMPIVIGAAAATVRLLLRAKRRGFSHRDIYSLGFGGALILIFLLLPSPLKRIWEAFFPSSPDSCTALLGCINQLAMRIDPVRAVHMKVMLRTFWEHPLFGTGLGSFYANYFEHLSWALRGGGIVYADPPASLYLMLISEAGILGLAIVCLSCYQLACMLRLVSTDGTEAPGHADAFNWRCFGIGMLLSFACSSLIGVHLIFLSVTVLFSLGVFATCAPSGPYAQKKMRGRFILYAGAALLAGRCVSLALAAPRVPEFRWVNRGKPQVPLSLSPPISTQGRSGVWLASGGEVLYAGKPIEVFVEMPPEYYPLHVHADLFDAGGQPVAEQHEIVDRYDAGRPGKSFVLFSSSRPECLDARPDHYCSVRIKTNPTWHYEKQQVGAFIYDSPQARQ